ncbi:unnamed protein product [Parascedosporium putredinis]|uniref:Altered inheritance of mitochondria protein 32 n=1 Tax=Parascedosporium putredinis TaxID=1442378 RepID=A0A9P1GUL7_9PEZI|nr:unnamed protein product [Parascedosporium putredinis]CAI7987329.1 unnamed protein product [Parascedosporium putredinis]
MSYVPFPPSRSSPAFIFAISATVTTVLPGSVATRTSKAEPPSPLPLRGYLSPPTTDPLPACDCDPSVVAATAATADLDIDRAGKLEGAFSPYAEQVLVCTGKDDWASRVEEDEGADGGGDVLRGFKALFGRGGRFSDPFHNVSFLASSFPSPGPHPAAYLLPSFTYIPSIDPSQDSLVSLSKSLLLPETLHPMHAILDPEHRSCLTRAPPSPSSSFSISSIPDPVPVQDVMILICGHGGRDLRCGILGPLLRLAFRRTLARTQGISLLDDDSYPQAPSQPSPSSSPSTRVPAEQMTARVGLISHIGGHKFAGNIIIYVPPHATLPSPSSSSSTGLPHPLAGCSVWYGRVSPEHAEGIVRETVLAGNVVREHFRGGLDAERKLMRI